MLISYKCILTVMRGGFLTPKLLMKPIVFKEVNICAGMFDCCSMDNELSLSLEFQVSGFLMEDNALRCGRNLVRGHAMDG